MPQLVKQKKWRLHKNAIAINSEKLEIKQKGVLVASEISKQLKHYLLDS